MTYVAGIVCPRFNAIICDMRVTSGGSGVNQALKSGTLFEGAIFGGSGNEFAIRNFVAGLKDRIGQTNATPTDCWEELQSRASLLEDRYHFDLLISSRHTGVPLLFSLSSLTRTITPAPDLCTLGSGGVLLDAPLNAFRGQCDAMLAHISDETIRDRITPYAYCHRLTELALGFEQEVLEAHGVGGVFHFIRQTAQYEARQDAAVYAACGKLGAEIHCLFNRIYFFAGMLIHEDPPTPWGGSGGTRVSIATTETPAFVGLDDSTQQQWLRYAQQAGTALPPYYYFGLLSADPFLRSHLIFAASNRGEFLWHPRTGLSPGATKIIGQMFEQGLPPLMIGGAPEGKDQDLWVQIPNDVGAIGLERHWGIILPESADGARCLFELADNGSSARFRWLLHADGTVEFYAADSDGRVIFARTQRLIPKGTPVCLGSSLLLLSGGTIASVYLNGETLAEQALDERFRFEHELHDFEDWTNRSAAGESTGELGLLQALMFKEPLSPGTRKQLVESFKDSCEDLERNCCWFMREAFGHSSKGLAKMEMTGSVMPMSLRGTLQRARCNGA